MQIGTESFECECECKQEHSQWEQRPCEVQQLEVAGCEHKLSEEKVQQLEVAEESDYSDSEVQCMVYMCESEQQSHSMGSEAHNVTSFRVNYDFVAYHTSLGDATGERR